MDFPSPLIPAILLKRYKRFMADVQFADGSVAVVHCANPGAMLGLAIAGARVWLAPSSNPKAKLAWRWELEEAADGLVGINTSHPNHLVAEAISDGHIAMLRGYDSLRREVAYGESSRVDLLLETGSSRCFVEVKNVHLRRGDRAEFPDCVTARGAKHLKELAAEVRAGHRAVMFFCIQRDDCKAFSIAADLDPGYAQAFMAARQAGVEAVAYACDVRLDGIRVTRQLEILA
jgi:sugar fermentation stimulation protein A